MESAKFITSQWSSSEICQILYLPNFMPYMLSSWLYMMKAHHFLCFTTETAGLLGLRPYVTTSRLSMLYV